MYNFYIKTNSDFKRNNEHLKYRNITLDNRIICVIKKFVTQFLQKRSNILA